MYLSKLELHGFKSFADRTIVNFSSGITAVVGPNGCGKSNIVDAVRWVIGEQRARILRSDKMDDIIFNGTSTRRALGMSEVLLTIENNRGVLPIEYNEVTIGRRLFRSGESEYSLNGVQCRLKDITDLFMDTGMGAGAYSVIELKMIEDILSDSASDRRHMFEEAAGISKYKTRRGQTLRKLSGTQTDLNRVRDLVDELTRRVCSIERQAKKASRFKRLDERLNYLVLALAATEYSTHSLEGLELKNVLSEFTLEITGLTARLARHEAAHEALRKEHIEKEQAVTHAQTELVNHLDMLRQAESDLRLNQERISSIKRDLVRATSEQEDADNRVSTLQIELCTVRESLEEAVPAADRNASQLNEARREKDKAESVLSGIRTDLQAVVAEENTLQLELGEHRRQIDRLGNRIEIYDQDLKDRDLDLTRTNASIRKLEKSSTKSTQESDKNQKQYQLDLHVLEQARTSFNIKTEELRAAETRTQELDRRSAAVRAEMALLESLFSSYDDISESVQHLASSTDWTSESFRTVADLFGCDDSTRIALDTALGEYASCIVVETEEEAGRAIRSLKMGGKGRATFIIANRLKAQSGAVRGPSSSSLPGAVPMSSLVRVPETGFESLSLHLLHDCFLVDDLESVAGSSVSTGRYFTADGEWFDAAGLRHGGSPATGTSAAASRLGRREQFQQLQQEIGGLEAETGKMMGQMKAIETDRLKIPLDTMEASLAVSSRRVAESEREIGQIDFEISALSRRRDELEERSSGIRDNQAAALSQVDSLHTELQCLEHVLDGVCNKRVDSESGIETLESASKIAFSHFNEINIMAVQTRSDVQHLTLECNRIESDLERLRLNTVHRAEQYDVLQNQLTQTTDNSDALDIELVKLRKSRVELEKTSGTSKDVLSEVKVAVSDVELELRDVRRLREEAMSGESRSSVRQAEIETRLADLVETMMEDYEIDISSYTMDTEVDFEPETARAEIRDLRGRVRSLGPVNALALESFDDEKNRLEFLQEQLGDLERAEDTLLATIQEINETASTRFNETFEAIRSNFSRLFIELFGEEATAEVFLVNPNDPLESPIEVMARPSGKKLSVLAQLSGGEKTLTAIALLFSIYLVKPSPFCILDEVDAPLDDANVDRFMHMIRAFSDSTQFILVTHNKRTMEAADCMYGITMAEPGVSKLVGVKFESEFELVA